MYILCDTCSVLMLIRIAPDMFCENRYGCKTMQEVARELFRTQKFKAKYPWRTKYKSNIKALSSSEVRKGDFDLNLDAVKNIVAIGTKNKKTGHYFNLSYVDQMIAACTIAHNFKLTTVDGDLADFVEQEFSGVTISPLGIINEWMGKKLFKWNDDLQEVIEDWDKCNEHPQPKKEVKRFEKLSGYKYAGPK
jgi:hypothetical protein